MNFQFNAMISKVKKLIASSFGFLWKKIKPHYGQFFVWGVVVMVVVVLGVGWSVQAADSSISNAVSFIIAWILYLIVYFLANIVGLLFKLLIAVSTYNNLAGGDSIEKGWMIIRDLCNMIIVILLLIYAFAMIIRQENKVGDKGFVVRLLIVAILINFSRLLVTIAIDIAQVFMLTFVNGFAATGAGNILSGIGMTQYVNFKQAEFGDSPGGGLAWHTVLIGLLISIVFLAIVALLVFMISVILLVRIVMLWVLVVFSPFAFLHFVGFKKIVDQTGRWWQEFGKVVTVGPLVAFMLWLSLLTMSNANQNMVTEEVQKQSDAMKSQEATTAHPLEDLDKFMPYALSMGLLYATYYVATTMSGSMGNMAAKWAKGAAMKYSGYNYASQKVKAAKTAVDKKVSDKITKTAGRAKNLAVAGLASGLAASKTTPVGKFASGVWGSMKGLPSTVPGFMLGASSGFREEFRKTRAAGGGRLLSLSRAATVGVAVGGVKGAGSAVIEGWHTGKNKAGSRMQHIASQASNKAIATYEEEMKNLADGGNYDALRSISRDQSNTSEKRAAALKLLGSKQQLGAQDNIVARQVLNNFNQTPGAKDAIISAMGEGFSFMKYDVSSESGKKKLQKDIDRGKFHLDMMDSSILQDKAMMDFLTGSHEEEIKDPATGAVSRKTVRNMKPAKLARGIKDMMKDEKDPAAKAAAQAVLQEQIKTHVGSRKNPAVPNDAERHMRRALAAITNIEVAYNDDGALTGDEQISEIADFAQHADVDTVIKIDINDLGTNDDGNTNRRKRGFARGITGEAISKMAAEDLDKVKDIIFQMREDFSRLNYGTDAAAMGQYSNKLKSIAANPRLITPESEDLIRSYITRYLDGQLAAVDADSEVGKKLKEEKDTLELAIK